MDVVRVSAEQVVPEINEAQFYDNRFKFFILIEYYFQIKGNRK
jgi:hypothetical protein